MTEVLVEQAIYGNYRPGGFRFLSRSPGFQEAWLADAERLCTEFGECALPADSPGALFVQPFVGQQIALVRVQQRGQDDAGRPGALGFHLLVLHRDDYTSFGADPFALTDRVLPAWDEPTTLPTLAWPAIPLPTPTVAQLRLILKRPDISSLLGGCQALLDGAHLVFERPTPDPEYVRTLWQLLPTRSRAELCLTTFVGTSTLPFHLQVVPVGHADRLRRLKPYVLSEEASAAYPEGRYESYLEEAIQAGDQGEIDRLLARRSRSDTWKLGLVLLVGIIVLALLTGLFKKPTGSTALPTASGAKPTASTPSPASLPDTSSNKKLDQEPTLPEHERALSVAEEQAWSEQVNAFSQELGITDKDLLQANLTNWVSFGLVQSSGPLGPTTSAQLALSQATSQIWNSVRTKLPAGLPGRIHLEPAKYGANAKQLRVLLWQRGVPAYADPRLNRLELLEKLRAQTQTKPMP